MDFGIAGFGKEQIEVAALAALWDKFGKTAEQVLVVVLGMFSVLQSAQELLAEVLSALEQIAVLNLKCLIAKLFVVSVEESSLVVAVE